MKMSNQPKFRIPRSAAAEIRRHSGDLVVPPLGMHLQGILRWGYWLFQRMKSWTKKDMTKERTQELLY
jgi:hypothetical protein